MKAGQIRRAKASKFSGLLLCCALLFGPQAPAEKIPETHAPTLAGNTINLPLDLHGRMGVLVLGFSKKSSEQCHGWDDRINRDLAGDSRVVYYEMPVLQDVPGFVRGLLIRNMRNDLPATSRARFVPLIQNETTWKSLVEFGAADEAYVLLVDDAGQVKWRTHGAVTAAAYSAFKTALAAMQK